MPTSRGNLQHAFLALRRQLVDPAALCLAIQQVLATQPIQSSQASQNESRVFSKQRRRTSLTEASASPSGFVLFVPKVPRQSSRVINNRMQRTSTTSIAAARARTAAAATTTGINRNSKQKQLPQQSQKRTMVSTAKTKTRTSVTASECSYATCCITVCCLLLPRRMRIRWCLRFANIPTVDESQRKRFAQAL